MAEQDLGRILPDMEVYRFGGHKMGTVAHVYRYDLAMAGSGRGDSRPPHEEVVEVKTGLLGLGKHLYIPMSAFQEVIGDSAFLSPACEDTEQLGWDHKPSYLEELQ